MTATMSQLNVRVDAAQRRQAEETLDLMGESLTKLIRSMLEKVSRGVKDAEEVFSVLADTPVEETHQPSKSSQLFAHIDSQYQTMAESLGVDIASFAPLSDEELEEALYDEYLSREAERMAWHA